MDRGRRFPQQARGRGRDNRPAWLVQQERQVEETIHEEERRPSKRPRVETVSEKEKMQDDSSMKETTQDYNEQELLLLQALDGDEFVSLEEKEAEAARQRRLKRKQRLERQQADTARPTNTGIAGYVAKAPSSSLAETNNVSVIPMREEKIDSQPTNKNADENNIDDDDDDGFDMFSSSVSPPRVEQRNSVSIKSDKLHHQQDWDDEEGYYKATIGETIDVTHKFRVQGIVGKGVFSTVIKCETLLEEESSKQLPQVTALKLIRHNETMAKAALTEIRFLQELRDCSGIIQLHLPAKNKILEHRGHTVLVFDYAPYNLRHVLRKFGRGVGLSLTGVRAYFLQLIQALHHLEKHGLIHADLKPDNILVSEDFGTLQLCDFGSAMEVGSDSVPTPYLVSRFYRAPEIVLGLLPTPAVDLWSVAATMGEVFLGRVLFDGRSNNDMLLKFMECLGPFSNRLLRQHVVACQKFPLQVQFQTEGSGTFLFLHRTADKVTGQTVTVSSTLQDYPKEPLQKRLLKARSAGDSRVELLQLSDLMSKCLALDPSRRIALSEAKQHDFFQTLNNNGTS